VRGDVFVEPWTDVPDERFFAGALMQTEPASAGPLTVVQLSTGGGKLVVHFADVPDRNQGEDVFAYATATADLTTVTRRAPDLPSISPGRTLTITWKVQAVNSGSIGIYVAVLDVVFQNIVGYLANLGA